jgi:Mg/Co/Ni transporter MgtE
VPTVDRSTGAAAMAQRAACAEERFAYVVDGAGVMQGWVDCAALHAGDSPDAGVTLVDWREATVRPDASLKEALSAMLGLGFRSIAVTDDAGRLLGDVALQDIESSLGDGDVRPG